MSILPKATYRFNTIPIKIPMPYFTELEFSKNLYRTTKEPEGPQQSWERKTKLEESRYLISNYTTRPQESKQHGTGIKTDISINEQMESPEINPYLYIQLIFEKGGKNIQWGKDSLINIWYWENWTDTFKKWN